MSLIEFYENIMREKKLSIQRFSGANEMTDAELLTFLHQLQSVAADGRIDLQTNDKVSMTEKFDGSPANWGLNPEFFIESANSGEVTGKNIQKFNNPYTVHFYKAYEFLAGYKPFQDRLLKAAGYADGQVKFISEMFPVLTHKGNECGDFIFCSTKYSKSKLGNSGSFMILDVKVKEGDSWVDPSDDIKETLIDAVRSPDDPEWKVYHIDRDGRLSGDLQFDFAGIKDWISSPEKLASSIALLRKKNDPNAKMVKDLLAKIRPGLQKQLDAYAEKTSSSLATGKSPIEGVVLKVNLPDGPTFIKGTSQIFHDIAAGTWGTRKELGAIEKTLTGQFLKDVIGLRTDQPAALNRAIAEVGKEFSSDKQGEELVNEFTNQLRKKLIAQGAAGDAKEARSKADKYLEAAYKQLGDIEKKWQQTKTQVDPDTIEKTESQMSYTREMLDKLKSRVVDVNYSGDAYMVYLLRMLVGRRIESFINKEEPAQELAELKNTIPGGLADNKTLEDIASKHNVPIEDIKSEYAKGIKVELEHTNDESIAGEIARDHLWEHPDYYTKLDAAKLEEDELDELDISNVLKNFKHLIGKKELPQPQPHPDTVDDLSTHSHSHPIGKGVGDLDDSNLPDQDPNYKPGDPRAQLMGHDETPEEIEARKKQKNANAVWDLAHGLISQDEFDQEYAVEAEEFDEVELLDERKFEKVKLARNLLSKIGYPKAFARNDKGKYVLRSKHIRKMMRELGYTFSDKKGRWIMKPNEPKKAPAPAEEPVSSMPATTPEPVAQPQKPASGKKAIIWVGRAQPWHKGHDTLIQQGLSKLGEVGADMIFIMLVKGAGSGQDVEKNPMGFDQQAELIGAVYANEQKVDISSLPVPTGSIVDILVVASKQDVVVKGWLSGSDRIEGYRRQLDAFKTDKYKAEFEQKTAPGTPYPIENDIQFIDVGREEDNAPKPRDKAGKAAAAVEKAAKEDMQAAQANKSEQPTIPVEQMSGSLARSLVHKLDFGHWFKEVCPQKYLTSAEAKAAYEATYGLLKGIKKEEAVPPMDMLRESFKGIFFGG